MYINKDKKYSIEKNLNLILSQVGEIELLARLNIDSERDLSLIQQKQENIREAVLKVQRLINEVIK